MIFGDRCLGGEALRQLDRMRKKVLSDPSTRARAELQHERKLSQSPRALAAGSSPDRGARVDREDQHAEPLVRFLLGRVS